MPKLNKGEIAPLNFTQEAKWRVFAGLGWDPLEDVSFLDKAKALAGGKSLHHDLDLSCYIYDREGRYISHVSTELGRETDQTGRIYHSGDNVEGMGEGDDEQISIELKDLDPIISNIIIKADIKSGHKFSDITAPEIHLSDGYTGHSFVKHELGILDGADHPTFVFVRLFKTLDDHWMIHNIAEFTHSAANEEWPEILKAYTRL